MPHTLELLDVLTTYKSVILLNYTILSSPPLAQAMAGHQILAPTVLDKDEGGKDQNWLPSGDPGTYSESEK